MACQLLSGCAAVMHMAHESNEAKEPVPKGKKAKAKLAAARADGACCMNTTMLATDAWLTVNAVRLFTFQNELALSQYTAMALVVVLGLDLVVIFMPTPRQQ